MGKVIGQDHSGSDKTRQESYVTSVDTATTKWVDCVLNVMVHAQKPDFVFRRNGQVHLNRRGKSVQSTTGSRGVRISGSNAGYTMFRGIVKSTGYPLHSPVSPSLPLPCVIVWMVWGSNPGGGEIFRTCPDRPWGPTSLLYNGYRVFPGGKELPGRDADPSPPSSAVGYERVELYVYSPMGRTACTEPQSLYKVTFTFTMLLADDIKLGKVNNTKKKHSA